MFIIISSSPSATGLTGQCVDAASAGIREAGGEVVHFDLCKMHLAMCRQCGGRGWGVCHPEHRCINEDDLPTIMEALRAADGLVVISPVYWGEMADRAKNVMDRIRRCEASKGDGSWLKDTPILAVAAAGGSGGGISSCLTSMERFITHVRGRVADLIGINWRNHPHTITAIQAAARAMVHAVQQERPHARGGA